MIDHPVSRRRFLQLLAGVCAMAGSGGLGGVLSGCSENQVGTNTTATIAAGETTTTSTTIPTTTTVVSTSPERGRPLRIGVLTGKTGRLALFGKADDWWMEYALAALPDGVLCGDRRLRKLTFAVEDHASSAEGSTQAATRLIGDARVDLLLASGSANVVNPAATVAEARECPFICDFAPWRPFVLDRGGTLDTPFKWTYAHAFGFEDISTSFLRAWLQLPTNKKAGLLFPDDGQGKLWNEDPASLPAAAVEAGYEVVLPGLYPVPAEDFSGAIDQFKQSGCEIVAGSFSHVDLLRFWKQAQQLGFQPKVVSIAGSLLFPQEIEALGDGGVGMTAECLWEPSWPYADSITGKTAAELAQDYVLKTGEQWTIAIAGYSKFEWAVDVFKRVVDILDKEDTIARVRTTRLNTCLGLIDFTAPVGRRDPAASKRPTENIYKAPVACCQWVKGSVYPFEPKIVNTGGNPEISVGGTMQPMVYTPAS
jgi:branched-chain amino acid transport system substrate-binding protein